MKILLMRELVEQLLTDEALELGGCVEFLLEQCR
jgi:hypothetical protein